MRPRSKYPAILGLDRNGARSLAAGERLRRRCYLASGHRLAARLLRKRRFTDDFMIIAK